MLQVVAGRRALIENWIFVVRTARLHKSNLKLKPDVDRIEALLSTATCRCEKFFAAQDTCPGKIEAAEARTEAE